jgi:hypothetical protein
MKVWHLTLSSPTRTVLFPDEAAARRAVRCILRVARDQVVLFCIVDDHAHIILFCAVPRLRAVRGALVQAVSRLSGQRLASHVTPVETRAHLNRLVVYTLRQFEHHGLDLHPAVATGCCYLDLAGARCLVPLTERLRELLPRSSVRDLHAIVGLPPERVLPASDDALRRVGAHRLVLAAAAAHAADPALADCSAPVVAARRATVHLSEEIGLPRSELVRALGLSRQRISQLAREPVAPGALLAIRLQITLADLVRTSAARRTG